MTDEWTQPARHELLRLRARARRAGAIGSGRRPASSPRPSPASGCSRRAATPRRPTARRAPRTRPTGSRRSSNRTARSASRSDLPTPGWTTAYALLLWKALGGYEPRRRRAASWLLGQKGTIRPRRGRLRPGPRARHDPRRLALGGRHALVARADRAGGPGAAGAGPRRSPPRVRRPQGDPRPRGRDRRLELRQQVGLRPGPPPPARPDRPGPPGPGARSGDARKSSERAIRYLLAHLPGVRAAESLGWGLLGLRAWGELPEGAGRWLDESYRQTAARPDAAPRLSLLLLAAGEHAVIS